MERQKKNSAAREIELETKGTTIKKMAKPSNQLIELANEFSRNYQLQAVEANERDSKSSKQFHNRGLNPTLVYRPQIKRPAL